MWLRTQPREMSDAFAARAALRVLPFVQEGLRSKPTYIVLPVFRALAFAWVAARYSIPTRGYAAPPIDLAHFSPNPTAASEAAAAAQAARAAVSDPTLAGSVLYFADNAVRDAAREAVAFENSKFARPFDEPRWSLRPPPTDTPEFYKWEKERKETHRSTVAAINAAFVARFWSAVSIDTTLVEANKMASAIASSPLWPQAQSYSLRYLWQDMKSALLGAKEDWDVWTT
jgi:hypothetical protein